MDETTYSYYGFFKVVLKHKEIVEFPIDNLLYFLHFLNMDIALVIIGGILILVGFVGTVVPVLPGAPLAWAGLLIAFFSANTDISIVALVVTGIIAVIVSVADNFLPVVFTKQSGGSKSGTIGSTVGLIVGLFIGPIGIIIGPFVGAFIGELIHDNSDIQRAFKAALGAFKGFLAGTGIKMIACAIIIWVFVVSLF